MKTKTSPKRIKLNRAKETARLRGRTESTAATSIAWIQELAAPYLKGYEARPAREDGLEGYWFIANVATLSEAARKKSRSRHSNHGQTVGFFVGYLNEAAGTYAFLHPETPECLVFAWIEPESALHEKIVKQPGSLVRKIFEYIRWLTHRPPRFVFHEAESAAMVRHVSMKDWPLKKRQHLSRNFFIETLAWLVRSGLIRKLAEEAAFDRAERKIRVE